MPNKPRLFISGDTHGSLELFDRLHPSNFSDYGNMPEGSVLIILGDAGILWDGGERDQELIDFLEDQPFTHIAFIDGNHDNHHLLSELESVEGFGGQVGRVSNKVYHLKRGHVYEICGQRVFCMGGALSIDKHLRTPYVDYWPEETPSEEEQQLGLENMEGWCASIDLVLTHTCPKEVASHFATFDIKYDPTETYLTVLHERLSECNDHFRWFFGHWHVDQPDLDGHFSALYREVIEVEV